VRRWPAVTVLLLAAAPALASAEAGEPATFLGLPVWLWKTANLLLFVGLLVYLLAKPLSRFFHARREEIARSLADAARQRDEAAAMRVEMEQRVAALEGEIAALRARLAADGEREKAELERAGEAEAARALAQLDEEARRRMVEAREALAGEAASIAAEMALEILERELTSEDRERIFRRTVARLSAPATGGAR